MSSTARCACVAWIFVALGVLAGAAQGHEVRPGFLEIRQIGDETFDVLWKVPARGARRLRLDVALPGDCSATTPSVRATGAAFVERWRATCKGGLVGREIRIAGLSHTRTDVLARFQHADGRSQTARLTPEAPSFSVDPAAGFAAVARTYFVLGVDHILGGIDHLCFVLALLFLVGSARRLVGTITAFTVAHSITLAAATLGWMHVAQPPVEAAIALSIVFVALEVLRAERGRAGLAAKKPWLVAFCFGLLHGLGFAGALSEVGLPEHAIPASLAFFNLGVEAGQLAFVAAAGAAASLLCALARRVGRDDLASVRALSHRIATPAAYAIGIPAAYWLIERTARF